MEDFRFSKEFSTLPDEAKAGLKKLEAMGKIGPIMMQALIKFVEQRHEQAKAQDPQQPGLKVVL
jgi:NAD-dependent DNA ligase